MHSYEYMGPSAASSDVGVAVVIGVLVVFLLIMLLFAVAYYVLRSLGCYTIAKRRGIHHPWLAWIPVGDVWILGSISDQYQYVTKGKVRNRRKVLLGLTIAMYALMLPVYIVEIVAVVQSVVGYSGGGMGVGLIVAVCSVVLSIVSVVACVFQYIAYYDLYSSCQPSNNVLYLVLSIIISVTLPIFVFICRNKDEGMPPRKQTQESPVRQFIEEVEAAEETEPVSEEELVSQEELQSSGEEINEE